MCTWIWKLTTRILRKKFSVIASGILHLISLGTSLGCLLQKPLLQAGVTQIAPCTCPFAHGNPGSQIPKIFFDEVGFYFLGLFQLLTELVVADAGCNGGYLVRQLFLSCQVVIASFFHVFPQSYQILCLAHHRLFPCVSSRTCVRSP